VNEIRNLVFVAINLDFVALKLALVVSNEVIDVPNLPYVAKDFIHEVPNFASGVINKAFVVSN